jgi:hypothetical protein
MKTMLATAGATLALAAPAGAALGNEPAYPWVTDGPVYAVAATPNEVYVGGAFTLIGRETGSWVGIDAAGVVDPLPPVLRGQVDYAVADGKRGWFVVVGADDDAWRLVHLLPDRTIDPHWTLRTDGEIDVVDVHGGTLYVGGTFTKVDGERHVRLAAVDIATRKPLAWNAEVTARKPKDDAMVNLIEVSPDGATVYFAGDFAVVRGNRRAGLAAVSAGNGKVTAWKPMVDGDVYELVAFENKVFICGDLAHIDGRIRSELGAVTADAGALLDWDPQPNGAIDTVVPAPGGNAVFVGGTFTSAGGKSRRGVAELDLRTGAATAWDANVGGEVNAILVAGQTVYLGGRFSYVGSQTRSNLAAADARTGVATAWDPRADQAVYVLAAGVNGRVLAGGKFRTVGAVGRPGLAALSLDGSSVLPWVPPVAGTIRALAYDARSGSVFFGGRFRLPGEAAQRSLGVVRPGFVAQPWGGDFNAFVSALALAPDSSVYAGGSFSTVQGKPRKRLVQLDSSGALTSWNSGANGLVSSLILDGDQLYAGGNFTSIGGASRRGLAVLDTAGGLATGWDAGLDGNVATLALRGDVLYFGGSFENVGARARNYLASVSAETAVPTEWDPDPDEQVNGLCLDASATQLYAVGEFATIGRTERDAALFDTSAGFLLGWRPDMHVYGYSCATSLDGATVYVGGDSVFDVFH